MARFTAHYIALFLSFSVATARLSAPDSVKVAFTDNVKPFLMSEEKGLDIAKCAIQEASTTFTSIEDLKNAQEALLLMAEDLNKLSGDVRQQVLLQTEEMTFGLKDVEAIDKGEVDPEKSTIMEEMDKLEGEYKGQGKRVMDELKTILDLSHCIEKSMMAMIDRD